MTTSPHRVTITIQQHYPNVNSLCILLRRTRPFSSSTEPAASIPVYDECDILVVVGGSAGHAAALAAARAGNKNIILMERYGYMGGDATASLSRTADFRVVPFKSSKDGVCWIDNWHSTICELNDCGPVEIPYGAILPKHVENLLAPGRHLSTDDIAIDWLCLIPQCVGTGQAAGVAAAVAVADGATTHTADIKKVQDILVDQNVPLPRNAKFEAKGPSYRQLVEEKQYGLYTAAKAAAEHLMDTRSFRQGHNYSTDEEDGLWV